MQQCRGVCVFFVMGRRKASTDVEISQSTIRYLSRHKHTHRVTANKKKKYKVSFFQWVSAISSFYKVRAVSTEENDALMWAIRHESKGWITPVWCVSSATSLECYSCSAQSSDNCVDKQQCSGGDDGCLKLSSNGTALIKTLWCWRCSNPPLDW